MEMCKDCGLLHKKLKEQNHEMWNMRKTISRLRGELRYEQFENIKLIKEKKQLKRTHTRKKYKNKKINNNSYKEEI